jgi:hypothetical protein
LVRHSTVQTTTRFYLDAEDREKRALLNGLPPL